MMHYRVRGQNVEVIRNVVDKKTLKSSLAPAGSANLKTGVLSEPLLAALSDKEVQDVRRWIHARQALDAQRKEIEARLLAERILEVAEWLKKAPAGAAAEVATESLHAMDVFRHVAAKFEVTKTRP